MLNPELAAFLVEWDRHVGTLPADAPWAERRSHREQLAEAARIETPETVDPSQVITIETDHGPVRARIFRFKSDEPQAALVYMHGGGWAIGSPETHWNTALLLAAWAGQTVISLDYSLSPEAVFPTAYEQCLAATRWIHGNAADLTLDASKLSVGGDSAGGALAASVAQALRGEVPLVGQLLIYPVCDFDLERPSMLNNPNAPIATPAGLKTFYDIYAPEAEMREALRAAPLNETDLSGLPPAYVALAEHDPLFDSGLTYAKALREAGGAVAIERGAGLVHGYMTALGQVPATDLSVSYMAAWLHKASYGPKL